MILAESHVRIGRRIMRLRMHDTMDPVLCVVEEWLPDPPNWIRFAANEPELNAALEHVMLFDERVTAILAAKAADPSNANTHCSRFGLH